MDGLIALFAMFGFFYFMYKIFSLMDKRKIAAVQRNSIRSSVVFVVTKYPKGTNCPKCGQYTFEIYTVHNENLCIQCLGDSLRWVIYKQVEEDAEQE